METLNETVFENQNAIKWLPCGMLTYVKTKMRVIFIKLNSAAEMFISNKSKDEENCFIEIFAAFSG